MNEKIHRLVMVIGGVVVVLLLYVVLALMLLPKGGLQKRREALWRQETAVQGDPTNFPTVKGAMSKPIDVQAAFKSTPEALAKGKALFAANCAACHGAAGRGDGPAAVALTPKPRNFTLPDGWTNGHTLADIFRTLSKGVPGTGMAAFDTLSAEERFALAHYVQSLGNFDHGADTPAQIASLDQEFKLSTGVQEPNKVAVWKVMRNMASEYAPPAPLAAPAAGDGGEGAKLYGAYVRDPGRLAAALSQVSGWRTDVKALIAAASADPTGCGLDPAVTTLGPEQWEALQAMLRQADAAVPPPAKGA